MKRYLLATLPCLALLAGGATALSAKAANTGELPPATAFSPIERYAISYDKPIDLAEFYPPSVWFADPGCGLRTD